MVIIMQTMLFCREFEFPLFLSWLLCLLNFARKPWLVDLHRHKMQLFKVETYSFRVVFSIV
ncbi:hypothetical protein T10_3595 [Trichinella papuae]|uniref:Uncharacterized protein n=1 Tax=Trichinella papuae TaxID=268474 RepID=A0A0V1N6M8_9BILA|nr:hypothetical protein T10_3595 [Trichinella papuae]